MSKGRLEAFSDGVIAILITVMVLELKAPHEPTIHALCEVAPTLGIYLMSFVYIGIYWNNHHHMFHATQRINGGILWANLHLLFWLSLISFSTSWMGENHFAPLPMAAYGVNLFMAGIAYVILQQAIIADQGEHSKLRDAVGNDFKGKASATLYLVAIGLSFVQHWLALAVYIGVACLWLVPDRRIEKKLAEH